MAGNVPRKSVSSRDLPDLVQGKFSPGDLMNFVLANKGTACGGGVLLCAAYYMLTFRPRNFPPGPKPVPFVGNVYGSETHEEQLQRMGEKYGPVFSLSKLGTAPVVVVNDFEVYQKELKPLSKVMVERHRFQSAELFGSNDGIISSSGKLWEGTRKLGGAALKHFGMGSTKMYDSIWIEAQAMAAELKKGQRVSAEVLPKNVVQGAVINVINSLCFGERLSYDDPRLKVIIASNESNEVFHDSLYVRMFLSLSWIFAWLPKSLVFKIPEMQNFLNFFVVVQGFQKICEEKFDEKKSPTCVMDEFLLEMKRNPNNVFTMKDHILRSTIIDLYLAGSDTTQNIIRWGLQFLALYPELQEELYQEANSVVGEKCKPSSTALLTMHKYNAFLHEVLRYVCLVAQGVAHCPTERIKIAGYDVPAGTMILVNQLAIHKDKRYWKYPETFNIQNFLDADGKCVVPPQYMPFGWGKRQCLGSALARAEQFVFTLKIMQEYKLSFPKTYFMAASGDFLRRPFSQPLVFTER